MSCCVNCLVASGSKAAGCGSFLKCGVRNEILSIDANFIVVARYYSFVCYHIEIWVLCELSNEKMWEDRSLDCFAHKFGLVLSRQRVTLLGTALTDMISSVYNFLVLNFSTQGFLWGVLLCLKIGSWKEMNREIFLWMLLFFCPSFSA